MRFEKLDSTDAFLVTDLDGGARGVGVARLAPKVLRDGAELLARSATYTFALFGVRATGVSAGINSAPESRDAAIAAFVEQLSVRAAEGALVLHPSTGLSGEDLAGLGRPVPDPALAARGALAAADAALGGGLSAASVAVAGAGPIADAARREAGAMGAKLVEGGLDVEAELLLVAGKAGAVDHEGAAGVRARVVVPLTAVPVTAKAHAVLSRAGVVHVPDFLSAAAALLAEVADLEGGAGDPVERIRATVAELAGEETNMWRAAVDRAETFLRSWQDELPFGRPLA